MAGLQGAPGLQGPAGQVLVLDGGVVTGPPGAAVLVTALTSGAMPCLYGGVRVTQLADGGIANVCNGAPGAPGPQGLPGNAGLQGAVGPQGVAGVQGPSGAGVSVSTLPVLSPQCMTGGLLVTLPDAGTTSLCNGQQGPQGAQGLLGPQGSAGTNGTNGANGAPGAAGPQGPAGLQGPQGPSGSLTLPDGGLVDPSSESTLVGFTTAVYTASLGGWTGANQKCDAEFPGSFFCSYTDVMQTETPLTPGVAGAWVDFYRNSTTTLVRGTSFSDTCSVSGGGSWQSNVVPTTSTGGFTLNDTGNVSRTSCASSRPLACCRARRSVVVRGFTTTVFTGVLGGWTGANQKCNAEFPGSFFCSYTDVMQAEMALAPGGTGAWVDFYRNSTPTLVRGTSFSDTCSVSGGGSWQSNVAPTTSTGGFTLNDTGNVSRTSCAGLRPLVCCSKR